MPPDPPRSFAALMDEKLADSLAAAPEGVVGINRVTGSPRFQ